MTNSDSEYAAALDELERRKASGSISQSTYDLHRTKLLAEAGRRVRNPVRLTVTILVLLFVALFVLRALVVLAHGG